MKRKWMIILIVTCFVGVVLITGCSSKKEETVKTGIEVVNTTEETIATDKKGALIGEADLIVPDTPEEMEAFIEQMR